MNCEKYQCRLSERDCAARHLKGKRELKKLATVPENVRVGGRYGTGKELWACGRCDIGALNAASLGLVQISKPKKRAGLLFGDMRAAGLQSSHVFYSAETLLPEGM